MDGKQKGNLAGAQSGNIWLKATNATSEIIEKGPDVFVLMSHCYPLQMIEGQSVQNGFMTFGYSINGGMDMDGNSYPDILVGSLDDRLALLR